MRVLFFLRYNIAMGRIVQLSKNVINQIAAGEVIERPFSVVKELAENSIDAGCTRLSIEVSNECRNIRVADNGSGIHPDDIILAFSKHATSKIQTGEDLYSVKTMGFRGEALASIISISKVTCITRTEEFDYGTKVECENSEIKQASTGCAVGTIMDVRDLFYNLPARLKFLKSAKTEFAYIHELIQSLALVHPDVGFELKNNGKTVIKTTGQDDLMQTIKEVFSSDDITKNLRPVLKTDKLSSLKISGFVSTPDYTRSSKKDYYMFVNSRVVKCPIFQKSIDMVYKNLTSNSRYPFIVLNLEIPPQDVDVNVHPAKKEVRYKNTNQIFNFIYSAIDIALSSSAKTKNEEKSTDFILPTETPKVVFQKQNEDMYVSEDNNIAQIFSQKETFLPKTTDNIVKILPAKNLKIPLNPINQTKFVQPKQIFVEENIIGQYKKTYILIEREEGLEIVDQHIADERYIYEQLKKSKNIDCQLIFVSDVLPVSPADKENLLANKDKLEKFGYEIEFVSANEIIFRKVPQLLSKVPVTEILHDILENISGNINNIEEQILITTSCKAAVKANTYLNMFQMQEIIKNWRSCEKPFTCPHGRPISKIIEHQDIAKFFQRNK